MKTGNGPSRISEEAEQHPSRGNEDSRRAFLRAGVALAGISAIRTGVSLGQTGAADELQERQNEKDEETEEEISPGEDLMREHGVLKRILLVYEEAERRLLAGADLSPEPIHQSATLIRSFIEDYHEKLEEDFLFPRYRKANRLVDLIDVLTAQHQAGRRLTDRTLALATNRALKVRTSREELASILRQFVRMYEPHEAREDTVLFPALRKIVTPHEYDSLGEDFEKKEHELFGEGGFEEIVGKVASIEKTVGIYDLAQFTPK